MPHDNSYLTRTKIKALLPVTVKKALNRKAYALIGWLTNLLEAASGRFITLHSRPRSAAEAATAPVPPGKSFQKFAIVMQGPIMIKRYFTVETLTLYRKFFPDALIILSTWEGENDEHLALARKTGAEIVLNRKPAIAGPSNVNLQLISTQGGIRFAADRGAEYLLKTRTDQRIYNGGSLAMLANLLKTFPLEDSAVQKGRIIGLGAYHLKTKKKLFHLFDQLIFGFRQDVQMYFDADLVPERPALEFLKKDYPRDPFTAEGYFCTEFLKKVGYPIEYTEESYLRSLARHCLLLDQGTLDLYWHSKHRRFLEFMISIPTYQSPRHLGFADWLNLYCAYAGEK